MGILFLSQSFLPGGVTLITIPSYSQTDEKLFNEFLSVVSQTEKIISNLLFPVVLGALYNRKTLLIR